VTTGERFEVDLDIRRRDTELRHAIASGEALRDRDGTVIGIHGSLSDITALKEAELHILELNEGLERRVRERTEELETFTYTLSHDLRAPLRWINGFAGMLQRRDGDKLDDTSRHYLDEIRNASDRMGRLFEELLDYSRMGRQAVRLGPVEWSPIVAALRSSFAPRLAEAGAALEIAEPLTAVIGDPMLLERILTNLVENGLTYITPGTAGHVTISTKRTGDRTTMVVADRGIGIAEEHRERIFNPFVRLNDNETYPGTGIGLAIVGRAARLMGSDVQVDSVVGHGSTFSLELPTA
jgi:signal transduction histidine kinase